MSNVYLCTILINSQNKSYEKSIIHAGFTAYFPFHIMF